MDEVIFDRTTSPCVGWGCEVRLASDERWEVWVIFHDGSTYESRVRCRGCAQRLNDLILAGQTFPKPEDARSGGVRQLR